MKRSEMLELIEAELHPCNSTYKTSRVNTAARILQLIEANRMEPPKMRKEIKLDLNNPYDRRHVVTVNEWEDE